MFIGLTVLEDQITSSFYYFTEYRNVIPRKIHFESIQEKAIQANFTKH